MNKIKFKKRDFKIAILTFITTIILGVLTFVSNKIIENRFFSDDKYVFTNQDALEYFPVKEGNSWVYEGYEESSLPGLEKTEIKKIDDFKMSVKKTYKFKDVTFALIEISNSGDQLVNKELWVITGGQVFQLDDENKINSYILDLEKDKIPNIGGINSYLQWDFPFFVGKKYNLNDGLINDGQMYLSKVTDKKKISILGKSDKYECYKIEFITLSGSNYSWFCPTIGMIEYKYTHSRPVVNDFFIRIKNFYLENN